MESIPKGITGETRECVIYLLTAGLRLLQADGECGGNIFCQSNKALLKRDSDKR